MVELPDWPGIALIRSDFQIWKRCSQQERNYCRDSNHELQAKKLQEKISVP